MRYISNAHFKQIDIVQIDRWDHGPLELAYAQEPDEHRAEFGCAVHEWNSTQMSGFLRSGEAMETLRTVAPHLEARKNPNIILAPVANGCSALDLMLSGLLPDAALEEAGLQRRRTSTWLMHAFHDLPHDEGARARAAFSRHIWPLLAPRARLDASAFASNSPLRLLAGDTRFWAHRLYRLALERRDAWCEPTTHEDEDWKPLAELEQKVWEYVPAEERHLFRIHRPLTGCEAWDIFDPADREDALLAAIDGEGVMESLEPVIELLHRQRAHEDFSARNSWIKEDFERSFYSKRARLKVDLVETIDDAPAYDVSANEPYEAVLFRDLLAFLNVPERRLLLAVREGRTASEIAANEGLRGHASVSRRIAALKTRVARLLQ